MILVIVYKFIEFLWHWKIVQTLACRDKLDLIYTAWIQLISIGKLLWFLFSSWVIFYCFCWVDKLCLTPCDLMECCTLGFPVLYHLLEFAQTHVHWIGDAIQQSHPLSFPSHPAFNLSQHQGLFKWSSPLHQVAQVLGFSFSISPSNEYSALISFRIDWFDLLDVQGTLKSILQHHTSKHQFFSTQHSL